MILHLHHAVRHTFSAKRRKYHFSGCDAKRADVDPAGQACYMTHDCKKAQQLASYLEERGTKQKGNCWVRYLRSDENIIFPAVMPSVRIFIPQDKRVL